MLFNVLFSFNLFFFVFFDDIPFFSIGFFRSNHIVLVQKSLSRMNKLFIYMIGHINLVSTLRISVYSFVGHNAQLQLSHWREGVK